jgi:hypothetical protein
VQALRTIALVLLFASVVTPAFAQKKKSNPATEKCSVCGGSIALVSGRGRHGADRYGCSVHHQRGESVCENAALVRRDELEEGLLKGLADSVLRIEVIDYAVARMEQALREGHEKLNAELNACARGSTNWRPSWRDL